MPTVRSFVPFAFVLMLPVSAAAQDIVADWAQITTGCDDSQVDFRAVMHVAMFDAANSIVGAYTPYKVKLAAVPGASAEAAVAAAAHTVFTRMCAEKKGAADGLRKDQLAQVKDSAARANGVVLGEQVAADIMKLRENSRADKRESFFTSPAPGVYVLPRTQVGTNWMVVTPWVMESASQFRPAPPPRLDTKEWVADFNEIKSVGGKGSKARTAEQTETARYWANHRTTALMRQLATQPGRTLIQNARLYALAEMTWADSYIAMFDGKYAYNLWRPVTAIRDVSVKASGSEGELVGDPEWEPLIVTPPHPEYPCGHCLSAASLAPVLEAEFGGDAIPQVVIDESGRAVRRYTSIKQFVEDVSLARLWGGVHYRTSLEAGKEAGRQIGELAVAKYFLPIKK